VGLYFRLLGALVVGAIAGYFVYRWLNVLLEGHGARGEMVLGLIGLGVLAASLRFAAKAVDRLG